MKAKTVFVFAVIIGLLYAVWKIVPAITSRIAAPAAAPPSSSYDVGSYQYTPWMQPTIPYPEYGGGDWRRFSNQPGWQDTLAQAGAGAGLQAAQYYWPSAFGAPLQPPDGGQS
jgi:hypothetical protein